MLLLKWSWIRMFCFFFNGNVTVTEEERLIACCSSSRLIFNGKVLNIRQKRIVADIHWSEGLFDFIPASNVAVELRGTKPHFGNLKSPEFHEFPWAMVYTFLSEPFFELVSRLKVLLSPFPRFASMSSFYWNYAVQCPVNWRDSGVALWLTLKQIYCISQICAVSY